MRILIIRELIVDKEIIGQVCKNIGFGDQPNQLFDVNEMGDKRKMEW